MAFTPLRVQTLSPQNSSLAPPQPVARSEYMLDLRLPRLNSA